MTLDYIVIGAGPCGILVHKELSKYKNGILLESGNFINTETKNVYSSNQLLDGYKYAGLNVLIGNPPVLLSEGKCIGGGSSVNSSLHHRAPDHIWAKWKINYGINELKNEEIDSLYEEVEARFNLSRSNNEMPPFYKHASNLYRVEKIPRWGNQIGDNFYRKTAKDLINQEDPKLFDSIKVNHHVTKIKWISEQLVLVEGQKKEELTNPLKNHKLNFKYETKNLFICAGAGHTPTLISKLGYRHNKLGKFQIHPTARISLIPKINHEFTEIVEPFQITEFFPYLMIGSSANREYLSRINYPYLNERNIDFSKCINLYSMAPSERKGEIRLRSPFKGVRSYFLSNEARERIKKGLKIILDIARRSKDFKSAYSPAGIIDLKNLDKKLNQKFIDQTINSTLCSVHIFSSAVAGKERKLCPLNDDGSVPTMENVFVMDSSVIPTCPTVNPQATACVFALMLVRKYIRSH